MNKGRLKQLTKWLTRQIVWLLILTIAANFIGAFVVPKKAKAVNTNNPASDGTYTQWTPAGAGSHYTEVNDISDVTYVYTTTDLALDSYGLTSGPVSYTHLTLPTILLV